MHLATGTADVDQLAIVLPSVILANAVSSG